MIYPTFFPVAQRSCRTLRFRRRLLGLRLFRRWSLLLGLLLLWRRLLLFRWRCGRRRIFIFSRVCLGSRGLTTRRLFVLCGFILVLFALSRRSPKLETHEILPNSDCIFFIGKVFFYGTSFGSIDRDINLQTAQLIMQLDLTHQGDPPCLSQWLQFPHLARQNHRSASRIV